MTYTQTTGTSSNYVGYSDMPKVDLKEEDKFGLENYVKALKSFIIECQPPLTIAIQGSWGTGKTSFMNFVEKEIENEVLYLSFSTWQYSLLNMQDMLAFSFLSVLTKKIGDISESQIKKLKEEGKKIEDIILHDDQVKISGLDIQQKLQHYLGMAAYYTLKMGAEHIGGNTGGILLEKGIEKGKKIFGKKGKSEEALTGYEINDISELKRMFNSHIGNCLQLTGKKRCVIFIDDLDRLPPKNAVELLEVIKVFLDCDNCVFVLAIDYSVVASGIKEKYKDIDSKKGKSFFDKIIQLPFKMPVSQYTIDAYVKDLFKNLKPDYIDTEVSNIIKNTISNNPRSIKRLFNSFNLTLKVAENKDTKLKNRIVDEKDIFDFVFCLYCIQLTHEDIYNYILTNIKQYEQFKPESVSETSGIIADSFDNKLDSDEISLIMELFSKCIDKLVKKMDGNEDSIKELLTSLTRLTSITATNERSDDKVYMFEGKVYKRYSTFDERCNTGWLGHDIVAKLITTENMDENKITEFREKFIKFKTSRNRYNETYHGRIIYLDSEDERKKMKTNLIETDTGKYYLINYWGLPDIKNLMDFIRNNYPDIKLKVTYGGDLL